MEEKKNLSEEEKKRLERFEQISGEMTAKGYTRKDLTVDIGKANTFGLFLIIPLAVIGYGLYYLVNHKLEFSAGPNVFVFFITILVLTVLHELIHGITWSLFTPNHFKDIQFGIMKPSMTPYCTYLCTLGKWQHITGTGMPLIVLGIIPMLAGVFTRDPYLLLLGIIMADAAAGDIMIIHRLLTYKTDAKEIVYMDHPTSAGGVIFER